MLVAAVNQTVVGLSAQVGASSRSVPRQTTIVPFCESDQYVTLVFRFCFAAEGVRLVSRACSWFQWLFLRWSNQKLQTPP